MEIRTICRNCKKAFEDGEAMLDLSFDGSEAEHQTCFGYIPEVSDPESSEFEAQRGTAQFDYVPDSALATITRDENGKVISIYVPTGRL